jgi:hypothetical protein
VTVVSGAAFGIDAAAHRGALAVDAPTVAVLACGLDRPYPAAHAGLIAQISRDWLDAEHKELHDYYMMYRHNFAAHSGDEKIELANTYVLLHPKRKNEVLPYLPTIRKQPDIVFSREDENSFEELITYVIELVSKKYNDLAFKIVKELIMAKDVAFWREKAKLGETVELSLPRKQRTGTDKKK